MPTEAIIKHTFRDHAYEFVSTPTALVLIKEIFADNYKVLSNKLDLRPNDTILDIGANEGMFSIFLSTLFPATRIIALEPVPQTYFNMVRNIGLNSCKNIEAYNVGIGKPGQLSTTLLCGKDNKNSGGASSYFTYNPEWHDKVDVGLISLDEAFELYKIDRCRILKIDIEGAEYDVLYPSTILPRVDFIVAEFHWNSRLDFQTRRPAGLITWCNNQCKVIHVDVIRMAE